MVFNLFNSYPILVKNRIFLFLLSFLLLSGIDGAKTDITIMCVPKKPKATISSGYALLIGISNTILSGYNNHSTASASNNINNIKVLLEEEDFKKGNIEKVINASVEQIKVKLQQTIAKAGENDLVVFYFFGHGDQIPDQGVMDETQDHKDEVLIANNGKLIDDDFFNILSSFKKKTRVLFLVDACNSQSSYEYSKKIELLFSSEKSKMNLDFLSIGAALDGSQATVDAGGSNFVDALEKINNNGQYSGNYSDFFERLKEKLQTSKYSPAMETKYSTSLFLQQNPFNF